MARKFRIVRLETNSCSYVTAEGTPPGYDQAKMELHCLWATLAVSQSQLIVHD